MRYVRMVLIALALAALLAPPVSADIEPDSTACGGGSHPRVVVFENANYGGHWKYFCKPTNQVDLQLVGFPGYCWAQNVAFTGTWAGCISSYKSYPLGGAGYVCLYTGTHYLGAKEGYALGAKVSQVNYNDQYQSLLWKSTAC